jgi:hypothetical protein
MANCSWHLGICRNEKGIGLADGLLIMAAVCGILTIYLPQLLVPQVEPKLKAEALAQLNSIALAIENLERDTNILTGYPGPNVCVNDLEFADLANCRLGLICKDDKYSNWQGPYLKQVPSDPWGNPYYLDNDFYQQGKVFRVLGSFGPNGVQDYGVDSDDIVYVLCGLGGESA